MQFKLLPINFEEVNENVENKYNISITQNYQIKAGPTFFSQSRALFLTIPEEVDIDDLVLIDTTNVLPQIFRK